MGKQGSPIDEHEILSFDISDDLSMAAFSVGFNVILLKANKSLISDNVKETQINIDNDPIKFISFYYDINTEHYNLYCVGIHAIHCLINCSIKKELYKGFVKLHDVNAKGELVCVLVENDTILIMNHNGILNTMKYEEEKVNMRIYKENYLVAVVRVKKGIEGAAFRIMIYDMLNNFIAYDPRRLGIKCVDHIIINKKDLFLLAKTLKEDKILIKINEMDDLMKLEDLLSRGNVDSYQIAYRFARNMNYDPYILADISLNHANHLYAKNDFAKAIK